MNGDPFRAATHLAAIRRCARATPHGEILAATPPGQRYPYVYPRDLAGASRALARLVVADPEAETALAWMEAGARFLAAAVPEDGHVGQRYDLAGADRSLYRQEDNPAHAARAIARYLDVAEARGETPADASALEDAMVRALRGSIARAYRPGVNLFFSTTTVHESAIERGYTLWNNLAHLDALEAARARLDRSGRGGAVRDDLDRAARTVRAVAERRFVQDGQFVRRLNAQGRTDRRPDVTLLSPFYFGFHDLDPDAQARSARRVERELWDPDLGLLQRYLPFAEDPTVHLHAGNGPWTAYSAILAQFKARRGDDAGARRLLDAIAALANPRGEIPEHLSTRERFLDWWDREWETGADFRKEFDEEILLPDVGFSRIVEELVHMRTEYERLRRQVLEENRSVLRFAVPLLWSHAEFLVALLDLGVVPSGENEPFSPPAARSSAGG